MEHLSGQIKLKTIFLDKGNWWKFFLKNRHLIRLSIIINLLKLFICKTSILGFHSFICPHCKTELMVYHTCKSRFCSSCGKKATDNWIKNTWNTLPQTVWQHITFTMPSHLWDFFWVNRYLMNILPSITANIILKLSAKRNIKSGIFLAIHTFGRDLKKNFHIHLSTTAGGLSLDLKKWVQYGYFDHDTIKKMWRYEVLTLLRNEFKQGRLKMPPHLKHMKNYATFTSWINFLYQKTWVVHLNKQSDNMKHNVDYLGKYLKRPPIGETRIKNYDGKSVTYEFLDHYTDTTETMTLPVDDFLARIIAHIPDKYFRNIRYYGFLANRVRGKLLPLVCSLLKTTKFNPTKVYIPWAEMIKKTFHYNPLQCRLCKTIMNLNFIRNSLPISYIQSFHKEIANGYFQRI